MAITSAMEKTRLAIQMLGKLLFAQTSEMIDSSMNGVLPPNLAFDNPGVSFAFKGVDINMAAYMSELAYLANPVGIHVQNAEMNNQAINSLALVSARYTQDAVDVLSLMAAAHLYTVCQAIELQVLFARSAKECETIIIEQCKEHLPENAVDTPRKLFDTFLERWTRLKNCDLEERCAESVKFANSAYVSAWVLEGGDTSIVSRLKTLSSTTQSLIKTASEGLIEDIIASQGSIADEYLGRGTRRLFKFVRSDLSVPALRGLIDHPRYRNASGEAQIDQEKDCSIGGQLSKIYMSIRDGRLWEALLHEDESCS